METKLRAYFSTPTLLLCVFLLVAQIANGLYSVRGVEPSLAFELISIIGFVWLINWWLKEDSKRHRVKLVYDIGFFLYLAWMFIIPYHLFKTRKLKAFITILSFIGIFLGTYLVGIIVYLFVSL